MDEMIKDALVLANAEVDPDILKKRKVEKYRKGVNEMYKIPDEIAILKEGLICALKAIAIFHPEIVEDEMYKKAMAYFNEVERIKNQAKLELGIIKEV
jgi:hypothetical protein